MKACSSRSEPYISTPLTAPRGRRQARIRLRKSIPRRGLRQALLEQRRIQLLQIPHSRRGPGWRPPALAQFFSSGGKVRHGFRGEAERLFRLAQSELYRRRDADWHNSSPSLSGIGGYW